jgi:cation transport regulator ChaC
LDYQAVAKLGFYYGSYMDPDVLRRFGANPGEPKRAMLHGWRLVFTPHANLVRDEESTVHGVLYELPESELDTLYGPSGYVTTYEPVNVEVSMDGRTGAAVTHIEDAPEQPFDGSYVMALLGIMCKVELPRMYIERIRKVAGI